MSTTTGTGEDTGFTAEEREAMKARAAEVRATKKRGGKSSPAEDAAAVEAAIAGLADEDRSLAERVHAVVMSVVPDLTPRLWYGMPAYAKDGKVLCFFQPAGKFKARYSTLGFQDVAQLDDGTMWPAAFALTEVDATAEAQITALVRRAVGG